MNRVVIVGGGFGGLAAAGRLHRSGIKVDCTLIDQKATSDFLPALPDVIGGRIAPRFLAYPLDRLGRKLGFTFARDTVVSLDVANRLVKTSTQTFRYDYLIIASGSGTNFYGREDIKECAYTLDSARDASKLASALKEKSYKAIVIVGGGYTGVEVATNARVFLRRRGWHKEIIIVEARPALLGNLPDWIRDYVQTNLASLDITIMLDTLVDKVAGNEVTLSSGKRVSNELLIWTAGVRTSDFIQNLAAEKSPQGRLEVDEYLRLDERCFVAGDAAGFSYQGRPLRMAVQFALSQGTCAADNVLRLISGAPLRAYSPTDLGYVVPMANGKSCGVVMGINIKRALPTLLHYFMCILRSRGIKNRLGILHQLLRNVC